MEKRKDFPRVALVTGGSRGFGQAIAHQLAIEGHAVAIADIRQPEETEQLVKAAGSAFCYVKTDITLASDIQLLAQTVEAELGPVDVLVANAGIGPMVPFLATSWETWRQVMDLNVDSMFRLFQTFIPGMAKRGWGRVIAMSSGSFYMPPPGFAAYVASKGAVIGLVRAVSAEVGKFGVTVNSVAPGIVETPGVAAGPQRAMGVFEMILQAQAIKREGRVEDTAAMIAFLASDRADFITGQTFPVDGGLVHL